MELYISYRIAPKFRRHVNSQMILIHFPAYSKSTNDIYVILSLINHRINRHYLIVLIYFIKYQVLLCNQNQVCWSYSGLFQNSSLVCHQIARYTVKVTMSNRGEKKGSLIPRKFETPTENKKPTKHDKNSGKRAVCQSTVENAV